MACNGAARPAAGNLRAFEKTQLCKFYENGWCLRGTACTFAHSTAELEALPNFRKSKLCADFAKFGTCANGTACNFAHGKGELRRPFVPKKRGMASGGSTVAVLPVQRVPAVPPQQPLAQPQSQQIQQEQWQRDEADTIRAQLDLLQRQLQALEAQQGRGAVQALAPEACKGGSEFDGLCGGRCATSAWSRQSTEEPHEAAGGFERQMSLSSVGSWADELDDENEDNNASPGEAGETPAQEASAGVAEAQQIEEEEEQMDVAIIVEKTFVRVVPLCAQAARLRSQSCPPAARGARAHA
mmetsp:Transcript_11616/g.23459  ORF Transcript_11616/g.23459 Transcript_11616/m.23459 type:complete len:298 (+) Transcript_11616:3-896(+)